MPPQPRTTGKARRCKPSKETLTTMPKSAPWTAENFDEAKARTLVENLFGEVDDLKAKLADATTENQTLKAAKAAHEASLTEATNRATKAEKDLWQERAFRKYPDLEEFADFIAGDTEEAVMEKAGKLAKLGSKAKGDPKPDDKKDADKSDKGGGDSGDKLDEHGRPKPNLTPGHGGAAPEPFDAAAIAKAARSSQF